MHASSPADTHLGAHLPIGSEKLYPGMLSALPAGLLNRLRLGLMGWLTVLLVVLAVATLVGTSWVPFARR